MSITVSVERPGVVTVASPGERMRIVAEPEQIATAAGQRVADLVDEALRLLDGAPDVPPEPGDEIPAAWEAGACLALPVTSLTEEQVARILASVPDDGSEPEWWWIERDGRIEVARVTFGDAHAGLKDPPQPWHAEVVGSERIVWPMEARLVVAVIPLTRP